MKRDSRMRVFLLRRRYLLLGAALALAAAMLFAACLPERPPPENRPLSPENGVNAYSSSSRSSQAKPLGHSSTSRRPWRFPPYISSV